MERQQLLKTAGKRPEPAKGPPQKEPLVSRPRDGARGLMAAIGGLLGRRSRTNLVCDVVVACFVLVNCLMMVEPSGATPFVSEKQLSTYHLIPSARNIRHLPCVSRRTKEEGICMFAIDCLKANGTHLGTCIDRFYFGSCCQIRDFELSANNIDDNSIYEKPLKEGDGVIVSTSQRPKTPSAPTGGSTHYITKKPAPPSTTRRPETKVTNKQTTSRPSSTVTESKYSTRVPVPLPVDRTEEELIPSLKPSRHNATAQNATQTSTGRPLTSRPTEGPSRVTAGTIQTTVYINNQLYNATKPSVGSSKRPTITQAPTKASTTTELPLKLTTFQTVNVQKTTPKPTTVNSYVTSKKPSQSPGSSLPFGTKLPATTPAPSTTRQTTPSSQSTTTPTLTTSGILSVSSQKPIKPTVAQSVKPDRPTAKPSTAATKPSARPTVQRPINSTLSNRRTTTTARPTTILKKPINQTEASTKKPTTIVYKPFTSLKPASPTQPKPTKLSTTQTASTATTQKPTDRTTKRPETTTKRPETVTVAKRPSTYATNATKISSSTKPTKPVPQQSPTKTTNIINATASTTPVAPLKINYTSSSISPIESSTKTPQKPIKIATTTPSPLTNEVDATLKPTTEDKIGTITTEKIGLVTWTSITGSTGTSTMKTPLTTAGVTNVTSQISSQSTSEESTTTSSSWVLLSTLSPHDNASVPTMQPSQTIQPSRKPIVPAPGNTTSSVTTPSSRPTEESQKENATTSQQPEEFTTFMYVSTEEGNATTPAPTAVGTNLTVDASTEKSTVSPIEGITSTGSPVPEAINMSDYTDVCGRRLWPEARVVGGGRATFGRWPWQISLRQWRTSTYLHKCGAALLNENWAITAAHCVDSVPPSDLLLRLGEYDLASEDEPYGFQERRVQIVASHPQFDPRTFEYDLALLRFYEPVTFQPNILPVCVPTDDEGFIGKTAYVTGWGRLYEDGPLPSVLQEVSVPVIENSQCENMYRKAGFIEHIPRIFICAGWEKGGFDSCEGDSGGPMVLQRPDKRFLLAGVISWGIGCAEPNQPGVYTRISQFRHWINQILQF